MAYSGLGNEGLFLGIESGIARWTLVQVSGINAVFTNLAVTNLTIVSGANIPAFDVLTVNSGGRSSNLGIIESGLWNGSVITEIYGGTGQSSYTAGDILYSDGTNSLGRLPSGVAGSLLSIQNGSVGWNPFTYNVIRATSSPFNSINTDNVILASGSSLILLPTSPNLGQLHIIKDRLGTATTTNVVISGITLIDGQVLQSLTSNYDSMSVIWDGAQWNITSSG